MTIDFKAEVEKRREALLADLFSLLEINSERDDSKADKEHPFGPGPVQALHKFLEIAERDGYETKNVDNYAGHFTFGEGDKTYTTNIYGDKEKQSEEDPFDSADEAKILMKRAHAILWAKLMQARLNENKNVAIADVAEETLNRMGITLSKKQEDLFRFQLPYILK